MGSKAVYKTRNIQTIFSAQSRLYCSFIRLKITNIEPKNEECPDTKGTGAIMKKFICMRYKSEFCIAIKVSLVCYGVSIAIKYEQIMNEL